MSKKIPVYAWYFPNWHMNDSLNEKWHGKGWSEWQSVKYASPRFDGHTIYHPLWGYEDESNSEIMGKKIDTAKAYGIDGFLWDYYWYEGVGPYRQNALEAFFKAMKTRKDFKIALNWCNHDSIYVHPAPYRPELRDGDGRKLLSGILSPQGFIDGTKYMFEKYFNNDCCMTIKHEGVDKLYFILWDMGMFVRGMGGVDGAWLILDDFRNRVRKAFNKELYIACVPGYSNKFADYGFNNPTDFIKAVGFDGCVNYGWDNHPEEGDIWPVTQYKTFVDHGILSFKQKTLAYNMPMNITVSQGWDSSPRTVLTEMHDNIGYPYCWITHNKNVADFKRGLQAAKAFYLSDQFTGDFITLACWNEWSEGNFLEPSVEEGYAYLEAVKEVFGTQELLTR